MVSTRLMTAAELENLEDDSHRYEIIDGELIKMSPANPMHGRSGVRFSTRLSVYVEANELGEVFDSSVGYLFGIDPDTVLEPDCSFIRRDRLPPDFDWDHFSAVIPDLVLEVLSPSERTGHINRKIDIYLRAGVRLLLLVNPVRRTLVIYAPDREPRVLSESDVFEGQEVVPGFTLAVSDLFLPVKK
jgi:Uma2 family endonuclease